MDYITPVQLADRPGALEIAQVATPDRESIVDAALMDATLRLADRSAWSADAIAIADAALANVQAAIDDTNAVIDGYLAKRYTLPLPKLPNVLVVYARYIVRYTLHKSRLSDEAKDPIVRDYRDALKFLAAIAGGQLSLGVDDPVLDNPAAGDVQFASDPAVFGRDEMKNFR